MGEAMSLGIEGRGRHLVEHRLEQMVIAAVDEGDAHRARGAAPWRRTARRTRPPGSRRAADSRCSTRREVQGPSPSKAHRLASPAREPHHVLRRRYGGLVGIGGVHAPPQVLAVGQGQERWPGPPAPAAEGPGGAKQIQRETWVEQRSSDEPGRERGPGRSHSRIIAGISDPARSTTRQPYMRGDSILSTMPTAAPAPAKDYRAEFPIFRRSIYLNSCSLGALSTRSRAKVDRIPRPLGASRGGGLVRGLVGGPGRSALALCPVDRGAGRVGGPASEHLHRTHRRWRNRSTIAAAPRSW